MLIREKKDSDGKCFGFLDLSSTCNFLTECHKECGTYECPFYKPRDKAAWIRVEKGRRVALFTSSEYFSTYR